MPLSSPLFVPPAAQPALRWRVLGLLFGAAWLVSEAAALVMATAVGGALLQAKAFDWTVRPPPSPVTSLVTS